MVSPVELAKKTMTPEKRKAAKNDLFAFYIGRPISYVLTIPFLAVGMKPNTVSLLSFLPSILGFVLLGFGGTKLLRIVGAFFFILWNFMDGVDGNIARYTNQTSTLGTLWDAASGYFAMMLMYFAVGVSVMNAPKRGLDFLTIPDYYYVVMAGLTAMFTLFSRLVMHKKMLLFSEKENSLRDKGAYSLFKIIALNLTSPSGFVQVIMLIAVAINCQREFVLVYFFIQLFATIYSLKNLLRS